MLGLDDLLKMWKEDSVIDELNLDTETVKIAKQHSKYLEIFSMYKLKYKKRLIDLDKMKKAKWLYFTGKMTKEEMDDRGWDYDPFGGGVKPLKSDMGVYYDADEDLIKIKGGIEYLKVILDTLEEIMNNIRWKHSHIKNMLDWKRFTAGG